MKKVHLYAEDRCGEWECTSAASLFCLILSWASKQATNHFNC